MATIVTTTETTDAALLAALELGVEMGEFVKITNEDDLRAYFATLAD